MHFQKISSKKFRQGSIANTVTSGVFFYVLHLQSVGRVHFKNDRNIVYMYRKRSLSHCNQDKEEKGLLWHGLDSVQTASWKPG